MTRVTLTEKNNDKNNNVSPTGGDVPAKRPPGKPPKYTKELARIARVMCERGAIDAELADEFGVTIQTICIWRIKHLEFAEACKIGKELADNQVERALYQLCRGYDYEEDKIVWVEGSDGKKKPKTMTVRKHVPADAQAAAKWLHNRRPEKWRDKVVVDVTTREPQEYKSISELREALEQRGLPTVIDLDDYEVVEDRRELADGTSKT